ncbi:amino acid ABC transporter ATP-binding protein [Treponema sp.]
MENIVQVKNLCKRYGSIEAVKNISFSVRQGEVLAIIGPSGSGKSTLLRTITHLEEASGGSIEVDGQQMLQDGVYADKSILRSVLLKLGLVFQNFNLFPHFSVLRNLTEAQVQVLKRDKGEAIRRAKELLERMGLSDKETAYPGELSGGQQQRIAIARALALDPAVLFFDEPTSALDPELTAEILRVIRSLAAEKMTMVIVTHEMAFAREVADRVVFMDAGLVVEEGPAAELIDNPKNERTKAFLQKLK